MLDRAAIANEVFTKDHRSETPIHEASIQPFESHFSAEIVAL